MLLSYDTVKTFAEHETTIKKSRFIASVQRVEQEQDALAFIEDIKNQFKGATHHCFAYMMGSDDEIQKANDNGEPSGTAGIPILDVIKRRALKDTVIVVTRYFGGIKLGAGGLIRAYGGCATAGIDAAGVVRRQLMNIHHITVDYSWLGKLEHEIRQARYPIQTIQYLEQVDIAVYVPANQEKSFTTWMKDITSDQAKITEAGPAYLEKDLSPDNLHHG